MLKRSEVEIYGCMGMQIYKKYDFRVNVKIAVFEISISNKGCIQFLYYRKDLLPVSISYEIYLFVISETRRKVINWKN